MHSKIYGVFHKHNKIGYIAINANFLFQILLVNVKYDVSGY